MKKIVFITLSILYSIICFGQQLQVQSVIVDNIASVDIPTNAQKVSKTEALSHVAKKFNNNKIIVNSVSRRKDGNMYVVDGVLVTVLTDNHQTKEGHLAEIKKGLDELYKDDKTYNSTLKTINNRSILVVNYEMGGVGVYRFFSFNETNSKAITGVLEFDKTDANKATAIVNSMIKGIKYKG